MKEHTLVLGASANPHRYSNRAIKMLLQKDEKVLAIGKRPDEVEGIPIYSKEEKDKISADEVDTITLYLNPAHQEAYREWIIGLAPRRVIFNPGSENPGFAKELEEAGIEAEFACTLVLLSTGQY